jgi:ABC-type transport system involved in multi-copper enzyme maturation permease subunit
MGGVAFGFGQAFNNSTITAIGTGSRLLIPTDGLWHAAVYSLEPGFLVAIARNAGRFAAGNPFASSAPPATAYLVWVAVWTLAVLGLGIWSFARRDL